MKKILFILSFAALIFSCKKVDDITSQSDIMVSQRNSLPDPVRILEVISEPTDGYVFVQSFSTYASQNFRGPEVIVGANIYEKNGNLQDFGALNFGNVAIGAVTDANSYKSIGHANASSLYGTSSAVTLAGKNNLPGFNTNFYLPSLISLSSPAYANEIPMSVQQSVTWNADVQNGLGIGIAIEYDPLAPSNKPKNYGGDRVTRLIHTEDDGSYTFSAGDLAGIPIGANFTFSIGRANYQKVDMSNGYKVGLVGYSVISQSFIKR